MSHSPSPSPDDIAPPHKPSRGETLRRWGRLTLKECRETLRDRRTIVTLILMPLLVYPLLGVAFQRFLLTSLHPGAESTFTIGVEKYEQIALVRKFLARGEIALIARRQRHEQIWQETEKEQKTGREKNKPAAGPFPRSVPPADHEVDLEGKTSKFHVIVSQNMPQEISQGIIHAGIRLPEKMSAGSRFSAGGQPAVPRFPVSEPVRFEIVVQQGNRGSEQAGEWVERCLEAVNDDARAQFLRRRGISPAAVPVLFVRRTLPVEWSGARFSIGALIPLILILMTITGAVYPAIDLTAGERERGTLETLVAAPIPRMGLLLAKYATVVLVSVLTATVNLVSMSLTIFATGLGPLLFGREGLSPLTILLIFALLILFAAFFSAILLALTSFARSFKEAQAYLIPLMLLSIAPGIFSMMPDLSLSGFWLVTPLANMVLLARDLFRHLVEPAAAGVVILSTLVYALAAILLAARVFGTDAILYGSAGTWSELLRRPERTAETGTPLAATLMLAIAFPAAFLLRQWAALSFGKSMEARLLAGGLTTVLVFGGLPALLIYFRRLQVRSTLFLRQPSLVSVTGGLLLGISLWPFAHELVLLAEDAGVVTVSETVRQFTALLVREIAGVSPWLVLLTLAVLPAVCEEFFFRGMFLSSLRRPMGEWRAIVLSAAAFAGFHVVLQNYLAPERLLPSFLMGLVLGWVCVRTGSIWPGVILHTCHNGLLVSLLYFRDVLEQWEWAAAAQRHLPWELLATAAVVASAGFALIARRRL